MGKFKEFIEKYSTPNLNEVIPNVPEDILKVTEVAVDNMDVSPMLACLYLEVCYHLNKFDDYRQGLKTYVKVELNKSIDKKMTIEKVLDGYTELQEKLVAELGYDFTPYLKDINKKISSLKDENQEVSEKIQYVKRNLYIFD